jgi:predicted Zn-dependent protease
MEREGVKGEDNLMGQPAHWTLIPARKLALSFAFLCAAGLAVAQTAEHTEAAPDSTLVSSASSTPSSNHDTSSEQAAASQPTAREIQAEGERDADPADNPPAFSPVSTNSAAPANAAPATAAIQAPNEPDKYNVALIGHRNVGNGLNFYSLEREIAVGQDLAKQVEQSSKLVTDPEVTDYVNRIGQNLVRNSDSRVPFTIKVIDSGEINAFALPGGFFYVDSGLILAAESESELAAIMAHEIAHVAARHATKNMTKQQIWNMASIPLMFVGGPAGYVLAEVASIAVPMGFLKFSRDSEREADMLGLQYDYAAGYDPQAFIQFFERLKAQEKSKHSKIAKLFSTHPMTADRISAAQAEIQTYLPNRDSYVVDTSEFESMKARLVAVQNHHGMNSDKGPNRPVLRTHTQDSTGTGAAPGAPPESTTDDRPTLKQSSDPD